MDNTQIRNTGHIKRIKREVKNLGWAPKEYAKKSGISPTSVSRYFNLEREIPLPTLEKIADTLEVSSIYLIGVADEVILMPELQLTPVHSANIERVDRIMKNVILFPYGNQHVYDKRELYTIGRVACGYKKI